MRNEFVIFISLTAFILLVSLLICIMAEMFRTPNTPKPKFWMQKFAYWLTHL